MRLRDFQKMGTVADVARRWSRGESRSAHGRARLTSRRRLAPVLVSSLGALVAAMAFGAAAASAERGHIFEKAFGSAGSGDGQLSEPRGVAVNEASGDVYVSDYGNHRVEQFTSAGAFMAVWGWGVSDGAAEFEVCASGCRAGIVGSG